MEGIKQTNHKIKCVKDIFFVIPEKELQLQPIGNKNVSCHIPL